MKKIFVLFFILLLCGCQNQSYIKNININGIEEKVKNEDTFILYIGSKTCHNCASFKPKLEKIATENKIEIFYIDVAEITEDEYNRLFKIVNYNGTPTVAFITNGEDPGTQTHIVGNVSSDIVIKAFKNNGFIK